MRPTAMRRGCSGACSVCLGRPSSSTDRGSDPEVTPWVFFQVRPENPLLSARLGVQPPRTRRPLLLARKKSVHLHEAVPVFLCGSPVCCRRGPSRERSTVRVRHNCCMQRCNWDVLPCKCEPLQPGACLRGHRRHRPKRTQLRLRHDGVRRDDDRRTVLYCWPEFLQYAPGHSRHLVQVSRLWILHRHVPLEGYRRDGKLRSRGSETAGDKCDSARKDDG